MSTSGVTLDVNIAPVAAPASPAISVLSRPASQLRVHRVTDPQLVRAVRRANTPLKRGLDVAIAGLGLIFLTPIMLPLAIAVWLGSDGPAFVGYERAGRHAQPFRAWRFRVTKIDSGEFTLLGRLISAAGIDGLPQLVNVLRGEMSLVGPQPMSKQDLDDGYGKHRCYYLLMRPGVTGRWRELPPGTKSFGRRIALDRQYICEWSSIGDIKILLASALSVLTGDHAARMEKLAALETPQN